MTKHIDHKGKYFTEVVSKDKVRAVIQTLTVRVEGDIHIHPSERFKDEFNKDEQFFAVTDAVVFNARGEELYRADFLLVNNDNIVWASPEDFDDDHSE